MVLTRDVNPCDPGPVFAGSGGEALRAASAGPSCEDDDKCGDRERDQGAEHAHDRQFASCQEIPRAHGPFRHERDVWPCSAGPRRRSLAVKARQGPPTMVVVMTRWHSTEHRSGRWRPLSCRPSREVLVGIGGGAQLVVVPITRLRDFGPVDSEKCRPQSDS
jgi:hypothetical protein